LLASAVQSSGFPAPVTVGLARLISGELPLDDWIALVRTTVPMRNGRRGWWQRLRLRLGLRRVSDAPPAS
jgi:glycerol-3-phosphate dehydrogenase (NAD(P)+)